MDWPLLATRLTMLTKGADIEFIPDHDEDGERIILCLTIFGNHRIHIPLTEKQAEDIRGDLTYTMANWSMTLSAMGEE